MRIISMFLILLLFLVGTALAAHPPATVITEYTYESELNPNEFIKWGILAVDTKGMGLSFRVVQKDNQVVLLRFYFGSLTGYAYYLGTQLYVYKIKKLNSDQIHFIQEDVTSRSQEDIDSWLDEYRNKIK